MNYGWVKYAVQCIKIIARGYILDEDHEVLKTATNDNLRDTISFLCGYFSSIPEAKEATEVLAKNTEETTLAIKMLINQIYRDED